MAASIHFNFSLQDYRVQDDCKLESSHKNLHARGRTEESVAKLFACHQELVNANDSTTLSKIETLNSFTHQLTDHVEASIRRRYSIFSYLIIFFGCGHLKALHKLQRSFDKLYQSKLNAQKDATLLAAKNPLHPYALTCALSKVAPSERINSWFTQSLQLASANVSLLVGQEELSSCLTQLLDLDTPLEWFLPLISHDNYRQLLKVTEKIPKAKELHLFLKQRKLVESADNASFLLANVKLVSESLQRQPWYIQAHKKLAHLAIDSTLEDAKLLCCLSSCMSQLPSDEILNPLVIKHPRFERLKKRYEQLNKIYPAPKAEQGNWLKQAYFIEYTLPKVTGEQFKKGEQAPFSMLRHKESKKSFITLKGKSLLQAGGAVKKVTGAIMTAGLADAPIMVAQATTRDRCSEDTLKDTRREFALAQQFKGTPGIWDTYAMVEHKKTVNATEISKISQFLALADGDLANLASTLSFEEFLSVSYTLLQGLSKMHEAGYVHADIKAQNVLLKRKLDGSLISGWIDFGTAFKQFASKTTYSFEWGFYGTHTYTPPEVFGIRGYQGNFFQADIWAFGLMLYKRYLNIVPSWHDLLNVERGALISFEKREEMKKLVAEAVEGPLTELLAKNSYSREERFGLLIYKMMRVKPTDRIDIKSALLEITYIQSIKNA